MQMRMREEWMPGVTQCEACFCRGVGADWVRHRIISRRSHGVRHARANVASRKMAAAKGGRGGNNDSEKIHTRKKLSSQCKIMERVEAVALDMT